MRRRILTFYSSNRLSSLIIIFIQIVSCFLLAIFIFRLFSFGEYHINVDGFAEINVFKSALALRISAWTIFICLIIGLPFRLNIRLYNWWTRHYYISIIGLTLGIALLLVSWSNLFTRPVHFTLYGQDVVKVLPNFLMISVGWFLTLFMTLHTYPSNKLMKKLEHKLSMFGGEEIKNEL